MTRLGCGESLKCLKQQAIKASRCCVTLVSSMIQWCWSEKSWKKKVGMINHAQLGFELRGHCFWIFLNLPGARARLTYPWFISCKGSVSESWRFGSESSLKWKRQVSGFTHNGVWGSERVWLVHCSCFTVIFSRANLTELLVYAFGVRWLFSHPAPDPTKG